MPWGSKNDEEDDVSVEDLNSDDFFKRELEGTRYLKVGIAGEPEVGKTHMVCTCPEPIYVLDTEFGSFPVTQKFDKEINVSHIPVLDEETEDPDAIASLVRLEKAIKSIDDDDIKGGTIAVDSMTDIWTWIQAWLEEHAEHFTSDGKPMRMEWGKANDYYRSLWMLMSVKPAHMIVTGHLQENYDSSGKATGTYHPKWQKRTPHWVDVLLMARKKPSPGEEPVYNIKMEKCRFERSFDKEIEENTWEALTKKLGEFGVSLK